MTEFDVSPSQWEALELVVRRADGSAPTYVVHSIPEGDAAIMAVQAEALERRGFININDTIAWPTDGGRRALASHQRMEERRAQRER